MTAFLPKFSDRKVAIDTKETSRPASPDHSDTKLLEGGRIANEHSKNENKLKHAANSQPLILGFMEKSDIKWDGERPDVGKRKTSDLCLLMLLAVSLGAGLVAGETSIPVSLHQAPFVIRSNSSSPSYFNGFAESKE